MKKNTKPLARFFVQSLDRCTGPMTRREAENLQFLLLSDMLIAFPLILAALFCVLALGFWLKKKD